MTHRERDATRNAGQSLGELLVDRLGDRATVVAFTRGEPMFHRGDPVERLYLVREGRLRLTRILPSGTPLCLQVADPGMVLAEASLYADAYHCAGEAETDGSALAIPIGLARGPVSGDVELAQALIRHLAATVMALRSMVELRDIRRADERVLAWPELHQPETGSIRLEGTIKNWASELGLSHEALYRALASLEGAGRVVRQGTTIRIVSP